MTADPILTLAWLALAHLAADFVLQSDGVAAEKSGSGRRALRALLTHALAVAACLVPVALAFGAAGGAVLALVTVTHAAIDRAKVVWTRRAEARALRRARREHETVAIEAATSLGVGWSAAPAALFVLDQAAHAAVLGGGWAVLLAGAPLTQTWLEATAAILGRWDPSLVHRVALTAAVLADLLIVNVRAGLLLVATLIHPRATVTGHDGLDVPAAEHALRRPSAYTLRLGPIVATAEPASPRTSSLPDPRPPTAPPAQVGAAIGVLERLIVLALVLTGAAAAIGFVIAAKTLARFKQLDDRDFAEYYLLGTLASVGIALVSGLVGVAVLPG